MKNFSFSRNAFPAFAVIIGFLALTLCSCSRNGFPAGSYKVSQQAFLASATSVVVLNPDHSGTIDVQAQALLDTEHHHSGLRWSYSNNTLQMVPEGANSPISLVLITRSETSVTWRGPDGSLVEWQKMGDGAGR